MSSIAYNLSDKVAIVTGARRGIGRGIALRLGASGAKVAVTDIDRTECETVVSEIQRAGGEAIALKLDISQEDEVRSVVESVVQRFGHIDILVNNAGIYRTEPLEEMSSQDIDRELAIDLRGAIMCCKHVISGMKQRRYGKIVNIASIAGLKGYPLSSIYCAAKGGLILLTKELAMELGPHQINVNAIAPGAIETPMSAEALKDTAQRAAVLRSIPYGRIGTPDDIANAVAFLCSDDSNYITGITLTVDGGWIAG